MFERKPVNMFLRFYMQNLANEYKYRVGYTRPAKDSIQQEISDYFEDFVKTNSK